jgi:DNA replication ATP-dependent helicase Dna2
MDSIQGRVMRVSAEPKTAAKGGYLFRGLELVDRTDARVFVIFPVFAGADLYEFPLLCWEGARIAAYDLQFNNELEDGSLIYTATPDSDLILEPHRPISVTEAVDAAACIRSVDCRYRVAPEEPFWMAKGKLIHTLFDHLVCGAGKHAAHIFREAFSKALPAFVAVLPGSGVTTNARLVEDDARTHFSNLKLWLKKNTAAFSFAEVETDRMSTRLGLKGRADAVFHNGDRRMILELKSGKVPVEDHFLQLFAYSLLFTEDHESPGAEGYILYSATGRAERLKNGKDKKKAILQGRNRAVALKRSYTVGRRLFTDLQCSRNGRCFSRGACNRLFGASSRNGTATFAGPEREYYDRWFQALAVEGWLEDTDFAETLNPDSLANRIAEGVTIRVNALRVLDSAAPSDGGAKGEQVCPNIEVTDDTDENAGIRHETVRTGHVRAELTLPDQALEITPGEEVILHRGDPCAAEAVRARVLEMEERTLVVGLKTPLHRNPGTGSLYRGRLDWNEPTGWFLDRVPFSRGIEVSRQALFGFFVRGSSRVIHAVVHGEPLEADNVAGLDNRRPAGSSTCPEDLCFSEGLTAELNEDQESAVRFALESDVYHLVHGPPGTGKTRVLARLIRLCLDRGERVLVACPTNVALDRLLLAVTDLGVRDFLRVGSRANVSREFLRAVESIGNPPVLLPDLAASAADFRVFRKRVSEVKLIGATAYQCAAHPLFLRRRFDRVIVDEAGQLDEPATLGPLTLAPRFVLGGDHLQLPPVVRTRNGGSGEEGAPALEQSLFERLYESSPKSRISRLNMQYRMNREVQDISSRVFYDGELFPSPDAERRRLNLSPKGLGDPQVERILDPERPVVFVDVEGRDTGKARIEEAEAAGRIVRGLLACGAAAHEIGIITPYRAQQSLIRNKFHSMSDVAASLSVDTVDRFQGGEREVILLSLVRSDNVTSFLADRKRLNVSLSRARSKLILLGHGQALREHELFASILENLEWIPFDTA